MSDRELALDAVPFVLLCNPHLGSPGHHDYDDLPGTVDFNPGDINTRSPRGLDGPCHIDLPECGWSARHVSGSLLIGGHGVLSPAYEAAPLRRAVRPSLPPCRSRAGSFRFA